MSNFIFILNKKSIFHLEFQFHSEFLQFFFSAVTFCIVVMKYKKKKKYNESFHKLVTQSVHNLLSRLYVVFTTNPKRCFIIEISINIKYYKLNRIETNKQTNKKCLIEIFEICVLQADQSQMNDIILLCRLAAQFRFSFQILFIYCLRFNY